MLHSNQSYDCRLPMVMCGLHMICSFFFNDTATTEIYTLSLHDALPIEPTCASTENVTPCLPASAQRNANSDRKSTRLNSSHDQISYAGFCLKKKNTCKIFRTKEFNSLNTSTIISFDKQC